MKRIFAVLLIAVMCLSSVGCSGEIAKYKKYEALINYMEAEDYESALAEMIRLSNSGDASANSEEAASEEKSVVAVEINSENWQEYFEIIEEDQIEYNNFNEIEDMYQNFYLVLKDGYEMAGYEMPNCETNVAVEYNYFTEWRYVEIDKENGVLTIGDLVPDRSNEDHNGSMITIYSEKCSLTNGRTWSEGMQAVPTGFEIVRMQGTLYIME